MDKVNQVAALIRLRILLEGTQSLGTVLDDMTEGQLATLPTGLQKALMVAARADLRMWEELRRALLAAAGDEGAADLNAAVELAACTCPMALRIRREHSIACPQYGQGHE